MLNRAHTPSTQCIHLRLSEDRIHDQSFHNLKSSYKKPQLSSRIILDDSFDTSGVCRSHYELVTSTLDILRAGTNQLKVKALDQRCYDYVHLGPGEAVLVEPISI